MERQFKGIWIPAHIWLNPYLTPTEKILLADIASFSGNGKSFYKTNETLAEELHTSVKTISRAVQRLSSESYIKVTGKTSKRLIWASMDSGQNVPSKPASRQKVSVSSQIVLSSGQNDSQLGTNCPPTNTVTNTDTNSILEKGGLVMPFESDRFASAWSIWIQERKARRYTKYTHIGEQTALHKLHKDSNEDESTAIEMIAESIANSWRGIFPLKNKNGKHSKDKGFNPNEYQAHLDTL